nr:hypothetical protein [Mannheimia haemolytica]
MKTVTPNPALASTQSGGEDPNKGTEKVALSAAEIAAAKIAWFKRSSLH